jgi:hypothetical protein
MAKETEPAKPADDVDKQIDAARPKGSNGGQDPRALSAPTKVGGWLPGLAPGIE